MNFTLSEEQKTIQRTIREFAQKELVPKAAEIDRTAQIPEGIVEKMAGMGLFGMTVPPPLGGSGAGAVSLLVAVEEVAAACASSTMLIIPQIMVEQGLLAFGTEAQKRYITSLAKGEKLCTLSLTEPVAGSDIAALQCKATPKGDQYVLNGTKSFACNAGEADLNLVLVRTSEKPGASGLSFIIVEKGVPGLSFGEPLEKLGVRGIPSKEMIFKDCAVPRDNLLGKEGMGLVQLFAIAGLGGLSAGTISVGIARTAFQKAVEYAKERSAFDKKLREFEATQFAVADMAISIDAARLLLYRAAKSIEDGRPNPVEVFMAKTLAGEMAVEVADRALQIFGGYGYTREFEVERHYRDARAFTLYPLTAEVYRLLLGRTLLDLGLPWKGTPPIGPPSRPGTKRY
ncbi:MAG: acyl-CoA dehydrogenase [Nitrososphaeria archaeon]|nr:acyl-CoA dehydrogenase [Nitrososphaeria archaeon]NIN52930.1 acyl-CoA dehydrogenase [Nitrososphaeria archaeon]NIQ33489.1 acyl-CoA dehydrogenase [Nitrososphaeria archaeon]